MKKSLIAVVLIIIAFYGCRSEKYYEELYKGLNPLNNTQPTTCITPFLINDSISLRIPVNGPEGATVSVYFTGPSTTQSVLINGSPVSTWSNPAPNVWNSTHWNSSVLYTQTYGIAAKINGIPYNQTPTDIKIASGNLGPSVYVGTYTDITNGVKNTATVVVQDDAVTTP